MSEETTDKSTRILAMVALLASIVSVCLSYYAISHTQTIDQQDSDIKILDYTDRAKDKLSGRPGTGDFSAYNRNQEALVEADRLIKKAEKLDSNNAEVLHRRGQWHIAMGRYENAVSVLKKSILSDPNHIETYVSLSKAYIDTSQYGLALDICDEGIQKAPNDAQLYSNKGMVLYRLGKHSEAHSSIGRALKIEPDSYWYNHNMGIVEYGLEHVDRALVHFEKTASLNPSHAMAHNNICSIYFNLKDYDSAKNSCKESISLNNNLWDSGFYLAKIYLSENDPAQALKTINNVVINNPEQSEPYLLRSNIYHVLNFEKEANDDLVRHDMLKKVSKSIKN